MLDLGLPGKRPFMYHTSAETNAHMRLDDPSRVGPSAHRTLGPTLAKAATRIRHALDQGLALGLARFRV